VYQDPIRKTEVRVKQAEEELTYEDQDNRQTRIAQQRTG
jgi:hypothetical protein